MRAFILTVLFLNILIAGFSQSISVIYRGNHFKTFETYNFHSDNTVVYESAGHGGSGESSGIYEINGDTISIVYNLHDKREFFVLEELLMDGDSCIINIISRWDYCKDQPLYSSKQRVFKYPQVESSNDSLKQSDLKQVLEAMLTDPILTGYYHFEAKPRRELIVGSYFAVNTSFPLKVEVDGKQAKISNKENKGFIQIVDINQNADLISIEFTIKEEGVSGTAVYKKTEGKWVKMYIPIKEK